MYKRNAVGKLALKVLGLYLAIILSAAFFQRSLIYFPAAEGKLLPSDFGMEFERIRIPAPVGPARHGWFVHRNSAEKSAEKSIEQSQRGIVVYCQGNGGALSDRAKVTALFDSIGLDTIMLSYRGYGDSGFGQITPNEAHIYEDAQAAYDFARARFPERKIIVWGHSLGAAVAAFLGTKNSPAAVVLESPFVSISAMVPVRYPWLWVPEFLLRDKFPTIEYVTKINAPLLVLVAQLDTIIPPSQGAQVFANAKQPKTFLPLTGINHNELPDTFDTFRESIAQFIRKSVS